MRLPNSDRAFVNLAKLRDYCLNTTHKRGQNKARVFAAALGLTASDAETLRDALLIAASRYEATPTELTEFGQLYVLDFPMSGPAGQAIVRSSWIVRIGEDFPRLTSCYVL
ncbi:MAG: hypothetical protein JOZ78_24615 [Chroococcidiopsidaceae cyanobacterium CP_BM_ER_R8_30]|nr:hypothetical protein [Chroococcidiopsidaceae cyanobacterium CP_BM_ER_R8_30]